MKLPIILSTIFISSIVSSKNDGCTSSIDGTLTCVPKNSTYDLVMDDNTTAYQLIDESDYEYIASSGSIAWGYTTQNMPGYTEVSSELLFQYAPFFDIVYGKYGFIGKATQSPNECAIILTDGMALKFEGSGNVGGWVRVAREEKCTFNWAKGDICVVWPN